MKSTILVFVAVIISGISAQNIGSGSNFVDILYDAWQNHRSGFQIEGEGTIIRLLPDDSEGSRHQRLIIRISPAQTLLIAHNIDVAKRVPHVVLEAKIAFYGVYEWNYEGGVIHWTHHDPDGHHIGGWLKYDGQIYQ